MLLLNRYAPGVGPQATSSMIFVQSNSIQVANAVASTIYHSMGMNIDSEVTRVTSVFELTKLFF